MEQTITISIQDYLKNIYELTENGETASTNALAKKMNVRAPSVTGMVQKMASSKPALVEYHKHQGVTLTKEGKRAALEVIRAGGMVIVVDDADRENEGDLTMAAAKVTPEAVNFMATYGKGLICVPLPAARCAALHLPPMVAENTAPLGTAFCVSVEARRGVGTGISAHDRATTIRLLADPKATAADFTRPGHVFPLRAKEGGVLTRAGQTEAAVDLARLAGCEPAGVICEILAPDGRMARLPELEPFAATHGLPLLTVQALIEYRLQREQLVEAVATTTLPTPAGPFTARLYQSRVDGKHHLALVRGTPRPEVPTLVRVHSECLTGDVFHSLLCDCGEQLHNAMAMVERAGRGVILYMRQEGRGIGLLNKMRAYELQDQGLDTVEANERLGFKADQRDYGIGAQILTDLGVRSMRLLTNNPRKFVGLEGYGLSVTTSVPLEIPASETTRGYLKAKKEKLGHKLSSV